MRLVKSLRLLALATAAGGAASALGCGDGPTFPLWGEPLDVTLTSRPYVSGETLPAVEVAAVPSGVAFQVSRFGFCALNVKAILRRDPGQLTIVATLASDENTVCLARAPSVTIAVFVAEYSGTVRAVPAGTHRVKVYERLEQASGTQSVLLFSGSVRVEQ